VLVSVPVLPFELCTDVDIVGRWQFLGLAFSVGVNIDVTVIHPPAFPASLTAAAVTVAAAAAAAASCDAAVVAAAAAAAAASAAAAAAAAATEINSPFLLAILNTVTAYCSASTFALGCDGFFSRLFVLALTGEHGLMIILTKPCFFSGPRFRRCDV
jgi:hypothetical protein